MDETLAHGQSPYPTPRSAYGGSPPAGRSQVSHSAVLKRAGTEAGVKLRVVE